MEASITLEYGNAKMAEAVANAVYPDNFKVPIGLQVKTAREKTKVITQIKCECKLATFTATIDDLLFSASTAEKTLQTITK
ncbi:MAG: KEOPS complex subunit Pcc1 [Candidatus Bathyarchaeia archaeon]